MITSDGKVLHFYVKIRQGKLQSLAETVYYRTDMSFEFAMRWKWYFEYRAARFRLEKPRYFTALEMGSFEPDPRTVHQLLAERLKNRITNKKGKITGIQNKMRKAKKEWTSLFPIEQDILYIEAKVKMELLLGELKEMETEYEEFVGKMNRIIHM